MTHRQQVVRGFFWSSVERFGDLFIKFGVQLLLARLLVPEDFGLVAMVAVFMTIGIGIMDAGFTQVVVQRSEITDEELTTVFYANLAIGILMTLLVCSVAPHIASFYSEPELVVLLRCLALTILFTAVGRIQLSQLMRAMLFKRVGLVTLPVHFAGGVLAILLAYFGFGVWALVWNAVFMSLLSAIGFWLAMRWVPSGMPSYALFKEMLPFGAQMSGVRILNLIAENGMFVVVGRVFSVTDVGYLQRAHSLRMISGNTLCVVAERVLFPFFSRIQQDVEALQKVYAKSLFLGGLSFAIVLSFMAANAEDLIVLLFGELWVPSANYFVVLCAFAFVYVFHRVVLLYVKSQGAGALLVRLTIVEQLLVLFTISVSVQFGIMLMLWCMVFSSAIALIVKYYILYKHYGCSFGLQLKQTCMPILVGYGLWWLAGQQMYANQAHPLLCILESACFVLCGLGSCLLIYTCACRREWLKIRSISQLKGAFKTVLE